MIGASAEKTLITTDAHAADTLGSGDVKVFATPMMVVLMESAALAAIVPHLEPGQTSVGIHLDIKHVAPTPIGQEVRARAEVVAVEGRTVTFKVEAWDVHEKIGVGSHQRAIIDINRFMQRVDGKK